MICLLDSSVVIAALLAGASTHSQCGALLEQIGTHIYAHALTEVFATLTGGRLGRRIQPVLAAELIESGLLPFVSVVTLTTSELVHQVSDWGSGVAIKMGRRQDATKEHI
jgi:hypothetical protein